MNLVGGQIRAKVTKDLLKGSSGPAKDKMQIKTKTAAMGVRGTDFNVTFNMLNEMTALITFEGEVAMVRSQPGEDPSVALSRIDQVQSVGPGQFSGAQPDLAQVSIPVKISPAQLETLKGNENFQGVGEKPQNKGNAMASPIPPGVNPKNFASGAEKVLQAAVAKATGSVSSPAPAPAPAPAKAAPPPEGFFNAKTGSYAPRAGGFIDLNSGRYIPPPPGSSFDANTGVFVPPAAVGQFDPSTGMYVPPKGVDLDPVKGFVAEAAPKVAAPAPGTPAAATGNKAPASTPPPPAAALALAATLNQVSSPTNAGVTATFTSAFTPTASTSGTFVPPPPPPPPPPPSDPLPPPPDEPVDDPTCTTCIQDNVETTPVNSDVIFNIIVQ